MSSSRVTVYLDGVDTRVQYNMRPLGNFRSAILKFAKAKAPITNTNSAMNGKEVASVPLFKDSTTLSLEFGIFADVPADYYTKYFALQEALYTTAKHTLRVVTDYIDVTLSVVFEDMTDLTDYNESWGRFILRFNEPNPADRIIKTN